MCTWVAQKVRDFSGQHPGTIQTGRSLTKKKKGVFLNAGFPKMPTGTPCVGGWRLAVGDWRLAVDGGWWRLMVVGGSWWRSPGPSGENGSKIAHFSHSARTAHNAPPITTTMPCPCLGPPGRVCGAVSQIRPSRPTKVADSVSLSSHRKRSLDHQSARHHASQREPQPYLYLPKGLCSPIRN